MLKQDLNLLPTRKRVYQAKLVFYLFLASLGMFFLASMLTYLIVRSQAFHGIENPVPDSIATLGPKNYLPLSLPTSFWVSTVVLVGVSISLHLACHSVRREKQAAFRRYLIIAAIAATIFVVAQCFGLGHLLNTHFSKLDGSTKVYGMSFTLSLIHALHVIGGMIFLAYVMHHGFRNRYDHEQHYAVDNCASYWHFLDVVWACMLVTFLITR